jgi:uncharacterized protein YdaU (DUF1376 family)
MHYYQFNIGDYRSNTAHLKPIEHYIYRSLIDWYYLDEKPIPKETQTVIRRLSIGLDSVNELENVLKDFFVLTEKGWEHGKIKQAISDYQSKADVNRTNGKLGGRPKKTQTVSERLANDNRIESESNPNYKLITNNHKPITNNQEKIKDKSIVAKATEVTGKNNIALVFEFWKQTMNHRNSIFDDKRKKIIKSAMAFGFSTDQLKQAIIGCSFTPHNMGSNENGTVYDGIHIIFKDAAQIERFIQNSLSPPRVVKKQNFAEARVSGVMGSMIDFAGNDKFLGVQHEGH